MISNLAIQNLEAAHEKTKGGSKTAAVVIGVLVVFAVFFWLGTIIEMWLYHHIVIGAMGAPLNPVNFWQMAGFDLFCGMLTSRVASKKD